MKYKAVIFDLFGTLIPNFSEKEYRRIIDHMASVLSAPPEPFWELWSATFRKVSWEFCLIIKLKSAYLQEVGSEPGAG